MDELRAVRGDHLGPALAEVPGRDDEVPLTGVDEVRHRRLERAGSRRGEEEHVVVRPEDLLQAPEHAVVRPREVRAAVVHHRLGHDRQHLRRDGRRARGEEVALLAARASEPSRARGGRSATRAVPRERHDLLERWPVRQPRRVRQEAERDALAGRVRPPRRDVGPLRRGELGRGCVDRGPQRGAARREIAAAAVGAGVARRPAADRGARGGPARRSRTTRTRTSCRRARAGRRASRAARAARSAAQHGREHGVREPRPGGVEDRRARAVDPPVELAVEAARHPRRSRR